MGNDFVTNTKNIQDNKDLRDVFIQNYGVKMDLPAYYFDNAKLVPHQKDFVVTLAYHIVPLDFTQTIQTTYLNGKVIESDSFAEIYDQTGQSIIIKLQEANGRCGFKTHARAQL